MWEVEVFCILALLIISLTHWYIKWNNPRYKNNVLPPGSMGFPFIGETLQFLIHGRSLDVHPFLKKRFQRYGPIFRTNLVGYPTVVSADPEFNHYLFMQEGKSVELWYFNNFRKIFGMDGDMKLDPFTASHRYARSTILKNFGTESLKEKLLPQIEKLVQRTLNNWSKEDSINVQIAVAEMSFTLMAERINFDMAKDLEGLSESFVHLTQSMMSFPLNIPGTTFRDSLKKKDLVVKVIREKLHQKLNSTEAYKGDLLDQLIQDMKTETFLTEEFVSLLVFGVLFVSAETISTTLTLAFKLLAEHPSIVNDLKAEHEEIISKGKPGVPLTWSEYKSMTFTLQVINEVLRLANSAPGNLRKAKKDIHVNGYTIPQGWTILLASSAQHLDSNTYDNPLAFNPHRWKELGLSVISKNFMPFGLGGRQCAGAEYSRVFMSIFFHVLCTKYRWTNVKGGDNISRKPFLHFGDGIYISVS